MLFFLQPAPDVVGAVAVQRIPENQPDNRGGFFIYQQAVLILRVFPVAERGKTAGKLAFLRFQDIGRMDFLEISLLYISFRIFLKGAMSLLSRMVSIPSFMAI